MHSEFWLERWRNDQIGWHQSEVNDLLIEHFERFDLPAAAQVFVPLCGKSLDMVWLLGQGCQVSGIEVSEIAVQAFFEEQRQDYRVSIGDGLDWYSDPDLRIACGDFFELERTDLGPVDIVYDRASLIAFPPERRPAYAEHLLELITAQTPILLITLEYPQAEMQGPPFSVLEDEVRALFGSVRQIEPVARRDILAAEPRFRERGLTALSECAWLLR